ncbi:MAG: biotin--[acetyl-CoA-carboxylase] ligase [Actinomycetia bacterium]|nr:biotin--[acetyl-CoA-carboxylase] ligase [Actinomycetes bacterium]MCP4223438.1 biotin--[acetyl-CoA-carboxylase] ligase [Actinomycetes bacterium]
MSPERELPGPPGTRFYSVEHVTETGSTNADLLERAKKGALEGIVLVTDHQTAGRGRQARGWHDEPGNAMLMSVLLRPAASFATLVPLLAGLAATDAVDQVLDGDRGRAGLKWPNDVVVPELGERKLAGILAEAITVPGSEPRLVVVVGMGLNLRWSAPPPPEIAARAAVLEELAGHDIDRWEVVNQVLRGFETWLQRATEQGPFALLDEYRKRCVTLGRAVRFQTPTDVVEGTAVAIADSGGLVIDRQGERITVTAGDAHHV